jgi:DNA-binding NarL/FixJ family response regulator
MSASLLINIFSATKQDQKVLNFFQAECLTKEVEHQLINKIHDILLIAKDVSDSIEIKVLIETSNVDEAEFLIKKKINKQLEISTPKLSIREIEVLGLIMQGNTNNEIAEKLFICYETVKSHRKNILEKTGAKNTAALINYYHQTFFEK